MSRITLTTVVALALGAGAAFAADEPKAPGADPKMQEMMAAWEAAAKPGKQHAWLAAQAGTYETSTKAWMPGAAPGAAPIESKGKVVRKAIHGGRVITEDFDGNMMGQAFTGHGMTGFDNVTGKYWTTWTDSMSTGLMSGTGDCDEKGSCAFSVVINDALVKGPKTIRLATRWTNANEEVFEMFETDQDGREAKTLEIAYKRIKK
jgi:hypothetical protein